MPVGLRTAPTVNGTPTYVAISLRFIDFTGDKRSVSIRVDSAASAAAVEALAVATVPGSNASLYEIRMADVYAGAAQAQNAVEEVWENVNDNIVLQFKDPVTGQSVRNYMPSPDDAWFIDGTDNIDITNIEFQAWSDALNALLAIAFVPVGVRFTPRKDNNPSTPL